MSESAKINLVGVDKETLLSNIAKIRDWDNGHNYPIIVIGKEGKEHMDTIDNVWQAINDDKIDEYLDNPPVRVDLAPVDLTPKKEPIKPDSVHRGSIEFEIRWYGNQAEIIIQDPDLWKRAAMLQQIYMDMQNLLNHMATQPKKLKGNFNTIEKGRTISAMKLLDKYINSYLANIYAYEHQPVKKEEPKAGDLVEENIEAEVTITAPTMTVVKDEPVEKENNITENTNGESNNPE